MALPYTLTAEFTAAVDDLVQDVALPDSTLQSRAQRYLEVFNESNTTTRVKLSPPWVERINKFPSHKTPFTTPNLFNVMCDVAGELGLLAGRRYVYAAICVCGEHVARVGAAPDSNPEQQTADRALHQLSSTWVAFLLWPFYAYGHEDRDGGERDDLPPASGDETPTAESMARERRRCWKEQVMARDDFRCFMSGGLDSRAYYAGRPVPPGARVKFCDTVPIISSDVWAHDVPAGQDRELQSESSQHLDGSSEQHIILGILARFCGLDAATFAEKVQGPPNTLFVHGSAAKAFTKLLWCLHPTETSDRYEIKSYMPSCDAGCEHVTSHVAFADHSDSGVDLPDRDLVRMHAALAGVLHRSGAVDAFRLLRYHLPWVYSGAGRSVYPASTGSAFWESVVEYEGWDVCREVELWCSDPGPEPVTGL